MERWGRELASGETEREPGRECEHRVTMRRASFGNSVVWGKTCVYEKEEECIWGQIEIN
jgi:hypothetical protein